MKTSFPIPPEAYDDRLAIVGVSGSGKTYAAGTVVERLLKSGARVAIIDPLDVWWGLRLDADGGPRGFPITIFGGAHADLPLNENAGKIIGETVAGMAESCIVSLGGLGTKSAERRFMLAFLETLYRKATGEPFHLIFDEADLWAPQKTTEPMLQNLMEQIVRRGRVKGFIPYLITQRPAVLSKDVLSQVDGLVAMKLTSSQDRDALGSWIDGQADKEDGNRIRALMPALQRGSGIVWLPSRAILQEVTFPPKVTFDSSRTPKRGEKRVEHRLKPLDVESLRKKLVEVERDAKQNDPRNLRDQILQLTAKIKKMETATPQPAPVDSKIIDHAYSRGYKEAMAIAAIKAQEFVQSLRTEGKAEAILSTLTPTPPAVSPSILPHSKPRPVPNKWTAPQVTNPQSKVLRALAWWASMGHDAPTREQVAAICGWKPGSGHFNNILGQLRTAELIEYPSMGAVGLTPAGTAVAPEPEQGVTVIDGVRSTLSNPQAKVFDCLVKTNREMTREDLAGMCDWEPKSGHFNNVLGSLRTLKVIDYPRSGAVALQSWITR